MSSNDPFHERNLEQKLNKYLDREKDSERFKVLQGVFDEQTIMVLFKLLGKGIINEIHGIINTGKEANVYFGIDTNNQPLAIKIYRTVASVFKNIMPYIEGDPRFKRIRKNSYHLIFEWTKKEYRNLKRLEAHGVHAPQPIAFNKNVLVMSFLGNKEFMAFPQIREVELDDPTQTYLAVIDDIKKMVVKCDLVHGDLSEFNLLYDETTHTHYVIDVSQAVLTSHPKAPFFLYRDLHHVNRYFSSLGVAITPTNEIYRELTGKSPRLEFELELRSKK